MMWILWCDNQHVFKKKYADPFEYCLNFLSESVIKLPKAFFFANEDNFFLQVSTCVILWINQVQAIFIA